VIEQIQDYLKGTLSYEVGCSLFLSISPNKALALNLLKSDSRTNRSTLNYQLKKYLQAQPGYWKSVAAKRKVQPAFVSPEIIPEPVPTPKPVPAPEPPLKVKEVVVFREAVKVAEASGIRQQILDARVEAYSLRGHLHGRLHQAVTITVRYEIAAQLMELQPRIDRLNNELAAFDKGNLPERFLKETMTAEQFKAIANCKSYINRYRLQLSRETDPEKKRKLEAKILKYELKLKSHE